MTAGHDVAFAYGLIRCGGTRPNSTTFEDWVRATFCLCREGSQWQIMHQHISMPMKR
ncbi:MAG: nuclear transport factor 2 family protein [Thainema sp.]